MVILNMFGGDGGALSSLKSWDIVSGLTSILLLVIISALFLTAVIFAYVRMVIYYPVVQLCFYR